MPLSVAGMRQAGLCQRRVAMAHASLHSARTQYFREGRATAAPVHQVVGAQRAGSLASSYGLVPPPMPTTWERLRLPHAVEALGHATSLATSLLEAPSLPSSSGSSGALHAVAQARVRATYLYAGGALALILGSSLVCVHSLSSAWYATALLPVLLGGFGLPTVLLLLAVSLPLQHGLIKKLCWVGFSLSTGFGLSTLGSMGPVILSLNILCAGVNFLVLYSLSRYPRFRQMPPSVDQNSLTAFYCMAMAGTLAASLTPLGPIARLLMLINGSCGIFLGSLFTILHMVTLENEAASEVHFDPIAHALTLLVNVFGLFTSYNRLLPLLRPKP